MARLHPDLLDSLPGDIQRPRYSRQSLRPGIVHLGLGAFVRAHMAMATEAAIQASGDMRWGMVGVSLRSPETRDALAPQQGLYTLALRDADAQGRPREQLQVIGNLIRLLVAPNDPAAVPAQIAAEDTRIVSLTITEKGYCRDPASGSLQLDHPDIAHDLAQPTAPRSAVGIIVRGLQLRHAAGLGPVTLLSLDNLPHNGLTLQQLVLDFAVHIDPELRDWIATHCSCPNTMVDRIVPRSTDADRSALSTRLGCDDAWPVIAEPYFDWVIEDRFPAGRPDWALAGARFVADAAPFEQLKLRMVNGAHTVLACLGLLSGHITVDRVMADPVLRALADDMLRDEVQPTLPALPGLDLHAYRAGLLQRFANPALQHATRQIASDSSQKLPQRLLAPLRERLQAGQPFNRLALGIAAWLRLLQGAIDPDGRLIESPSDPLAKALATQVALADAAAARSGAPAQATRHWVETLLRFTPVFGDLAELPHAPQAVDAIATALRLLQQQAAHEAVATTAPV